MAREPYRFISYDSRDENLVQFYIRTINGAPHINFTYISPRDRRWADIIEANDIIFFIQDNVDVASATIAAPYDSENGFRLSETPLPALNEGNYYGLDYSRDRPEEDRDVPVENRGWSPLYGIQYLNFDDPGYSVTNTPTPHFAFRLVDWTSGRGTKPQLGYLGITGIVSDVNNAAILTLPPGPRGDTGRSGTAGADGTRWTEGITLSNGNVVGDMHLFPEAVASGLTNYFQANGTTAKADAVAGEVARWDGTKWRFVMVLSTGGLGGIFVDMHDGLRDATADDYGKVGIGPDGKLYRVKRNAAPGHDAAGVFNAYVHALFRGVAHNRPSNPQVGETYYNIRIHQWYVFFLNQVVATIDAQPITPVQALGANTVWIGEVDDVYQARHAIQDFDNTKAYYAVYGEVLYVLNNSTYTAATTETTYTYQWIEILPDDVVTTAELEATVMDKLLPTYPPAGSRNDKIAKFDGDTLGWEYDGKGLTPQEEAQFDSLVAKTADLLIETRETWVAATDASFLALPADNAQLARVRAGNVPIGLSGWTTDVTTTDPRVILIRVPSTAQLADYRILLGDDNAVRLDAFAVDAVGTTYAYMTSTSLVLQEAARIRLQHHGAATHTRFIGMLADALMARLLPDLPAEGSRDNKVPRFDGDNLVWEILTGGTGGGLTEQQITAIANARAAARFTDEEKTKLAAAVITSDLDPYGLGFIGIYPRYMRFDQLEDNIIIAFGEIHEPYDTANRIEINFNGVQVVRNEWSPATRFFRFGITPPGPNNIINNTHRDDIHWDVQITFFKDGFLDNQVIGNIRTIPVIINRELEPPDVFAIQSQLSRAAKWADIPNDTAIPDNYIVRHSNRYFGAKVAHTKTTAHVAPTGDPTNWIELSNGTATFSQAQLARLLPQVPAEGSRDNKVPIFDGNTLGWEVLTASGLTTDQLARLLPALPAPGSRDDKIVRFNGDVLGWEDLSAVSAADGKVIFGSTARPANNVGKVGDTFLRRNSASVISLYEKTATSTWTFRYDLLLLPTFPSTGSRDDKILRFDGNTLGWEDLSTTGISAAQIARLLPELPAEGSRDDKIPKFNGDVLGWETPVVSQAAWDDLVARGIPYFRAADPQDSFGSDDQWWYNLAAGKLYQKRSGSWVLVTDLALESELQAVRQLPTLPAEGSRDDKILRFAGNNLGWEDLSSAGLSAAQIARLLPTLPATGSRDDKFPIFNSDTLRWEDFPDVTPPDGSIDLDKLAQEVKDSIAAQASIGSYFDGLSDPLGEGWLSNVTGKWSASEHAWGVIGSPGSSSNNDRNNPLYQSNEQIDWEKSFSFRYRLTFKRPAGSTNQAGSFQTFWGGNAFTTVPSWIGALTQGMGFWCNRVRTQANVLDAEFDNYLFFGLLVPSATGGSPARLFSRWLSTAPSHTTLYNGALRTSASSPARAIGTTFRDSNFGFFIPETDDEADINIVGFGAYVYLYVNNTLYARIDTSDLTNHAFGPRFGWMGDATGVDGAQALLHEAIVGSPDPINALPRQVAEGTADGRVLYGTAVPAGSLGKVGDTYLRSVTGAVGFYEKTSESTWTFKYELANRQTLRQTLTSASTLTWNVSSGAVADLTLGHNVTLNISGGQDGDTAMLRCLQDTTGSRTLTFHSSIQRGGRDAPTLNTGRNQRDYLLFTRVGTTWIYLGIIADE